MKKENILYCISLMCILKITSEIEDCKIPLVGKWLAALAGAAVRYLGFLLKVIFIYYISC